MYLHCIIDNIINATSLCNFNVLTGRLCVFVNKSFTAYTCNFSLFVQFCQTTSTSFVSELSEMKISEDYSQAKWSQTSD